MQTKVLKFTEGAIGEAARLIKAGELVVVPTETVYGLAADATVDAAVAKIYAVKVRPSINPLIVHVPDLTVAKMLGSFSARAEDLGAAHWPGPLTIVVPLFPGVAISTLATAGLNTIALRVPENRAMQALLQKSGVPLAAPSANASGTISPTRPAHVLRTLNKRIPLIIDDGPTTRGIESTIVAASETEVRLLRAGPVIIADAVDLISDIIESPGQLSAHYAPSKPLRLGASSARDHEVFIGFGTLNGDMNLSVSADLVEAASRLFELLHWADAGPVPAIAVAPIPEKGLGIAINDRLRRAAAGAPQ